MKNAKLIAVICFGLLFPSFANAQLSKSINLTTAGALKDNLTYNEKQQVTNLTLTGKIDARDIALMRDSLPQLAVLNMAGAVIDSYVGEGGTSFGYNTYAKNQMPFSAFNSKYSLTNVTLSDSLESFDSYAFVYCTGLLSVTLPNSLTSFGFSTFSNCPSLSNVTIPNSITDLGDNTFKSCSYMQSITIPSSVTSIGLSCFAASGLTSIVIPNSVTNIKAHAFNGCASLKTLSIPNSVTTIGNYAFANNNALQSVTIYHPSPNSISLGTNLFNNISLYNIPLHIPTGSLIDYKTTAPWMYFGDFIEMNVTSINEKRLHPKIILNPKTGNLDLKQISGKIDVTVTDIKGRIVLQTVIDQDNSVSMGNLGTGIYLVIAKNESITIRTKIVKSF
jgi:hypothetical protein